MRELHVVAVSDDGQSVVLATSRGATRGGYRVALDDRLTSAVLGDLAGRPAGDVPPVDVTPKEIQARVRAGESVAAIAASAGVPIGKIERYAGPVLSEIARVLDEARAGYVSRSRLGASALPLGRAVDQHLAETTGVRPETVTWSARREQAGTWLVQVSYVSQARRRTATWRYDVARREVTATDSPSAQLAHVEPGRAAGRGAAPPPAAPARATPAAKRVAPQSRRPASEPTRRTAPAARTVVARGDAPRRAEVDVAAQARAQRAAAAQTAEADRALAAARAAELTTAEHAARRAEQDALDAQSRRRAKTEAERAAARRTEAAAARTAADRTAKAEAARKAKADAARTAKAEAARKAKADAARKAKADAARKAKAEAARRAAAERKNAAAAVQEAAQLEREAEQARVDDVQVPSGPPTLRVVGGGDAGPAPPSEAGPCGRSCRARARRGAARQRAGLGRRAAVDGSRALARRRARRGLTAPAPPPRRRLRERPAGPARRRTIGACRP